MCANHPESEQILPTPLGGVQLENSLLQMPVPLVGGLQMAVDLACAFDARPRQRLQEGMCQIGLPARVIDIVMQWHQQAPYTMKRDDKERLIDATQGVRQGCAVAPILWLIYPCLISAELAKSTGATAPCKLLSILADDYHGSAKLHTVFQLETKLNLATLVPSSRS